MTSDFCFWVPEYSWDRRRRPREAGASLYPELYYEAPHARVLLRMAGVWTPRAGQLEHAALAMATAGLAQSLVLVRSHSAVLEQVMGPQLTIDSAYTRLWAALRIRRFCVEEIQRPGEELLALMRAACARRVQLRWGGDDPAHAARRPS